MVARGVQKSSTHKDSRCLSPFCLSPHTLPVLFPNKTGNIYMWAYRQMGVVGSFVSFFSQKKRGADKNLNPDPLRVLLSTTLYSDYFRPVGVWSGPDRPGHQQRLCRNHEGRPHPSLAHNERKIASPPFPPPCRGVQERWEDFPKVP